MSSVDLENVHKRYGDVPVVRGVSLSVAEGEFLVLVGRSGCGKSTTLRMIAGLEEISEGVVKIGGRVVNDVAPKDRDIGMVFQSYALYPHMSVRRNIAFGLELRRLPRAEIDARVDEVAKSLELTPLLERKPRELSGGQRQRVAMGRAIARRPKVFLFDEPLSNLDAALRVQMRAELGNLHRQLGATMIYVTHDQVEAMTLATRIAVLEGGVLQQVAPPLELFHRPANRFVAGFIGSPAMNLIDGRVDAAGNFVAPGITLALGAKAGQGSAASGASPAPRDRGDGMTLGIRPHDVRAGGATTKGVIEALEPMGWETYAHVRLDAGKIVVRLEGEQAAAAKLGEILPVGFAPERIHLFDSTGASIRAPAFDAKTARASVQ